MMNLNGHRWKKLVYDYDLISGKVNRMVYEPGLTDQMIHQYRYDAENRLTQVETSRDSVIWQTDARYYYYNTGRWRAWRSATSSCRAWITPIPSRAGSRASKAFPGNFR